MCLAIPGQIVSVNESVTKSDLAFDPMNRTGRVNFSGIIKEVSLAYVPEANVGDYVIVHVGFAISTVDEKEAQQVFSYLDRMGELGELRHDVSD